VLQCVSDVKTMVACTLVSTEIKQHTHRAVKGHLPALISACHYRPYEHDSKPKKHQPFLWLRGVAGDSWRSFEAGCAMLEKVMERDPRPAADFLVDIGTISQGTLNTRMAADTDGSFVCAKAACTWCWS
jgi:hypothetical protein